MSLNQDLKIFQEDLEVAIIGCYVNGPGESKAADIGLTGASPIIFYILMDFPRKN